MQRPTFITGIGGFIGLRLAERLHERGASVWGIDHDRAAVERARARGLRAEQADVNDASALAALMRGAEAVVHTAAIVKEHGALAEFRRVNVEGTRTVASAALGAGVRTFVQLSSVMVYGFTFPPDVAEDGPLRGEQNPYCQTKIESEQVLAPFRERLGVIVVRPGDVYGPGSVPWIARPLRMLRKRRLLLPGRSGVINPVYVDDLVDGMLLAMEREAHGQTFNLSAGTAVPYADYFARLAQVAHLPPPTVVPVAVMRGLVRVAVALRARGLLADEVAPDTVDTLLRPHAYSIAKARSTLGYAPRVGLGQGLALTRPYIESELARTGG